MNKITKYFTALLLGISVFTMSNVVSTEAASWKLVDSKTVSASANAKNIYLNGVKKGKAKICLKNRIGGMRISVYDNDGNGIESSKEIFYYAFIGNNKCLTFDATPYIDGADNNAEFIVVPTRGSVSSFTLELWD